MAEIEQAEMNQFNFFMELMQSRVFTKDETYEIISKIRKYELKMVEPGSRSLDDFKFLIKYEEGLLMELKRRQKDRPLTEKIGHLEWIFTKRILGTYRRGIKLFNQCDNVEEMFLVSYFLLRSHPVHPSSLEMYLDVIELELKNALANGVQWRLKIYIDEMVKSNVIHRFLAILAKVFKNFPDFVNFGDYVIEQMLCHYRHEPAVWHWVALEELKGEYNTSGNADKRITSYSIERSVTRYKEGILALPSAKKSALWNHYLKTLFEVQKKYTDPTTSLLMEALDRAGASEIQISESHYLEWMDCCGNNHELLVMTLEAGVKNRSDSLTLWFKYFEHHIIHDEPELANKVFHRIITAFGTKVFQLRDIDIMLLGMKKVNLEALYECAISYPNSEVAISLKCSYLEWMMRKEGIDAARELYLKIAPTPPYSRELHRCMLYFEITRNHHRQNKIKEQVLELWSKQFGLEDIYHEEFEPDDSDDE